MDCYTVKGLLQHCWWQQTNWKPSKFLSTGGSWISWVTSNPRKQRKLVKRLEAWQVSTRSPPNAGKWLREEDLISTNDPTSLLMYICWQEVGGGVRCSSIEPSSLMTSAGRKELCRQRDSLSRHCVHWHRGNMRTRMTHSRPGGGFEFPPPFTKLVKLSKCTWEKTDLVKL